MGAAAGRGRRPARRWTRVVVARGDERVVVDVHHREAGGGAGPPVVLLHGLGMSSRSMLPLLSLIAPHRRALAPDLPGSGRSRLPGPPLDPQELAGALLAWCTALDLPPVVLVGHSYGAQVAVAAARREPARVERLVLAAATRDPAAPAPRQQVLRLLRDAPREHPRVLPLAVVDYLRAGPRRMLAALRQLVAQPEELELTGVAVPALVVHGALDPVTTAAWSRRMAQLLPAARLVEVPGAPHGVVLTRPGAFWEAVRGFVLAPSPVRGRAPD